MAEVRGHLRCADIDRPDVNPADLVKQPPKLHPPAIGEAKRHEVRFLILSGVPHKGVVRMTGLSGGTVSAIRKELKSSMPLYRNTESDFCVPIACPTEC